MNSFKEILHNSFRKTKPVVLLTLLVFSFINLFIVILNHYYFRTIALDYAIYNFAFYDYAHLRISPCPAYIYPFPATFLQDHFSLTLMLLSPLYWLMSPITGTYSLLIIQWAFIVAGAWYTYKLIERKSANYIVALCAMLYYFLLLGRYNAYREDVNLAIIGSSFVPVFLYYFDSKKIKTSLLCFLLLLINREDYALWLFFICLFLALVNWKDVYKRKLALVLMSVSVLFFILIFTVIFPAIEDENKKFVLFNFAVVGETPMQAFRFIINNPLKAIEFLFVNHSDQDYYNGVKQQFYLVYLISGGFILLLRPHYLIPFIPLVAKKMYDDNPLRWSIETYYSIEVVSILPVMVFSILSSWKRSSLKLSIAFLICVLTLSVTFYRFFVPVQNPIMGESYKINFLRGDFYQPRYDVAKTKRILELIPPNALVCASNRLLPHLAYRKKIYYFPRLNDAQYICLFKKDDTYPLMPDDFDKELTSLINNGHWNILEETEDVILLKRK